jgi:hypothetical protein
MAQNIVERTQYGFRDIIINRIEGQVAGWNRDVVSELTDLTDIWRLKGTKAVGQSFCLCQYGLRLQRDIALEAR